jgi:hypothetical protein
MLPAPSAHVESAPTAPWSEPIDVVYTWVDGDDPVHRALSAAHAGRPADLNPERTRDVYDLLRYSLRSVERFAPWIRTVHVVTCRPQVPAWLDTSRPDVRVVHHDEICDEPDVLPTFSCHVIESFLHRVPGVSEHFLYLNDDYLFGRPVTPADFIAPDGTILVYGTVVGERIPFVRDDRKNDLVSRLQHEPLLVHRPSWEAMLERWRDEVAATRRRRFRTKRDVMMHGLYRHYLLTRRRHRARAVPVFRYWGSYRFHKITNDLRRQRAGLDWIRARRPKFYCLNDDQGPHPAPEVVRLVQAFLEEYYPGPSRYER